MKHIAAYLLLVLGGNAAPTAEDVTNVIVSGGGEADEAKVAALIAGLIFLSLFSLSPLSLSLSLSLSLFMCSCLYWDLFLPSDLSIFE